MASSNYLHYIDVSSWPSVGTSNCWLPFAWVGLKYAQQGRHRGVVLFAAAGYLLVTAGFPHAVVCLAVVSGLFIAHSLWRWRWVLALRLTVLAIAAPLLAAISYLPLLYTLDWTTRKAGLFTDGALLVPTLGDALNVSYPYFTGTMQIWNGKMKVPFLYCSVLLLPMLPFVNWSSQLRRALARGAEVFFLLPLAVAMVCSPEQIWILRWPARFVPFWHLALVLAFGLLIDRGRGLKVTWGRGLAMLALWVLSGWGAVAVHTDTIGQVYMDLLRTGLLVAFLPVVLLSRRHWLLVGYGIGGNLRCLPRHAPPLATEPGLPRLGSPGSPRLRHGPRPG